MSARNRPGAFVENERSFYFRRIYAESMFVELGAAGFAGDCLYFGNFEKYFFDHAAYFVRFFERDARQRTYIDGKRTFIERREKLLPSVV